jgi:hypothetical protein
VEGNPETSGNRRISGTHITVMVVAVCGAIVLAPVGVYAAAHSRVSIADGKHPTRVATVSKKGALTVAGTVKVAGTAAVKVSGTPSVKTLPGLRGTPYAVTILTDQTQAPAVPAGRTFVVTTVSGYDEISSGDKPYLALSLSGGTYQGTQLPLGVSFQKSEPSFDVWVASEDVEIPLPAGATMSLTDSPSTGHSASTITLVGYLV